MRRHLHECPTPHFAMARSSPHGRLSTSSGAWSTSLLTLYTTIFLASLHFVTCQEQDIDGVPVFYPSKGTRQEIPCEPAINNQSGTQVTWTKDERPIELNLERYEAPDDDWRELVIPSVTREDEGNYTCTVTFSNNSTLVSTPVLLKLAEKPRISKTGEDEINATAGTEQEISCVITDSSPPATKVEWTKDGHPVNLTSGKYGPVSVTSPGLVIKSVQSRDEGDYVCNVSNAEGSASFGIPTSLRLADSKGDLLILNKIGPPVILTTLGARQEIACVIETSPAPATKVEWTKDGQPVNLTSGKYEPVSVTSHGLVIKSVQSRDEGDYVCNISKADGSAPAPFVITTSLRLADRKEGLPILNETGPSVLFTTLGARQEIACVIEASHPPATKVEWTKDGQPVNLTSGKYGAVSVTSPGLVIKSVQSRDEGDYVCNVSNAKGSISFVIPTSLRLADITEDLPILNETGPPVIFTTLGARQEIACVIEASHFLAPKVEWTKDGQPVNLTSGKYEPVSVTSHGLVIKSVQSRDEGDYVCNVSYAEGSASFVVLTSLRLADSEEGPPILNETGPPVLNTTLGARQEIACAIDASHPPVTVVEWLLDGVNIDLTSERYSEVSLQSPELVIHSVEMDDVGEYVCNVTNALGSSLSAPAYLEVTDQAPPQVAKDQEDVISAHVDQNLTLSCVIARSSPPATEVNWTRDGHPVNLSSDRYDPVSVEYPDLTIYSLTEADEGQYVCTVTNPAGSASFTRPTTLRVEVPGLPQIAGNAHEITAYLGFRHKIPCLITYSYPAAEEVEWTKDGQPVTLTSEMYEPVNVTSPSLTIKSVTRKDEGDYVCTVNNSVGSTAFPSPTTVKVAAGFTPVVGKMGKDVIETYEYTRQVVSCMILSSRPPATQVQWFKDGHLIDMNSDKYEPVSPGSPNLIIKSVNRGDRGSYVCAVSNDVGTSVFPKPTQLKLAVGEIPRISRTGNGTLTAQTGTRQLLSCVITHSQPRAIMVVWTLNGKFLDMNSGKYESLGPDSPDLIIKSVSQDDQGAYNCFVANSIGTTSFTRPTWLQVEEAPSDVETRLEVAEGQNLTLDCPFKQELKQVKVTWQKVVEGQNTSLDVTKYSRFQVRDGTHHNYSLIISLVGPEDNGEYYCEIHTRKGEVVFSHRAVVAVKNLPVIQLKDKIFVGVEFKDVTLPCPIVAPTPPTSISWFKLSGGTNMSIGNNLDPRYEKGSLTDANYNLVIHAVERSDAGYYFCEARSEEYSLISPLITLFVKTANPPAALIAKALEARPQPRVQKDSEDEGWQSYWMFVPIFLCAVVVIVAGTVLANIWQRK